MNWSGTSTECEASTKMLERRIMAVMRAWARSTNAASPVDKFWARKDLG